VDIDAGRRCTCRPTSSRTIHCQRRRRPTFQGLVRNVIGVVSDGSPKATSLGRGRGRGGAIIRSDNRGTRSLLTGTIKRESRVYAATGDGTSARGVPIAVPVHGDGGPHGQSKRCSF